jgi:peptidoglycan hydrolase-like protein with peptidoglycan-binding domain
MAFITREQWGAAAPRGTGNPLGDPTGVTVHWEGPKIGTRPHSQCAALVRSIQAFHQNTRGWSDIAYNLLGCEHGDVFEGRGASRGNAANGSTASNLGRYSVCALVGQGDPITDTLKAGILDGVAYLRRASGRALPTVDCHSDWFATSCPGPDLRAWVKAGAGHPAGDPASSIPNLPATPAPKPKPAPAPSKGLNVKLIDLRDVSPYVTGPNIKPLQRLLGVPADGLAGPGTRAALGAAQRRARLAVDYIFGPNTAEALLAGK